MRKVLSGIPVLLLLAIMPMQAAGTERYNAKCVLNVEGVDYINGPCTYESLGDADFYVASDIWTAYVYVNEDGYAEVYWNGQLDWVGDDGNSHYIPISRAGAYVGYLKRSGACLENRSSKVCAWR